MNIDHATYAVALRCVGGFDWRPAKHKRHVARICRWYRREHPNGSFHIYRLRHEPDGTIVPTHKVADYPADYDGWSLAND